ncbi:tetratricopeptide repeat protein [Edaphobacter albus]|uniref:tetratricopeptide repeat protein n=1 Tax=Edaphobacter sp. 4G125 TaxID=2763071 RepID=UPI001647F495|nr:tetratricopeptide repeat protein [Edaphobacter sp. 4G125]QNI36625.1 tetratricopeptide repeat protein [Edaphobacter sp. 4G125]
MAQRTFRRPAPHWTETLPFWIWLLVIVAWTIFLYGRSLQAPFVYDDLDQIVRNPNLASWHNIFARFLSAPVAFTSELRSATENGSTYRPLYWLSLALDRHLWGLNPIGFHLTNVLLHTINGVLLFRLLHRLHFAAIAAASVTLLWLSLPINSEAVAWISARAYPLCFFFLLLSLLATVLYIEKNKPLTLIAAFLATVAALFSHESGILIFPFAALVILLCSRNEPPALKQRSAFILLAADLTAIAFFFILRHAVGAHSATGPSALWGFAPTFWKYLGWILLPIHMSVERSTSTPANVFSTASALAWMALIALIALSVYLWKRIPSAAFGVAWLLIALAPFCGIVFLYQGMGERFATIASAGVAIVIVVLIAASRPPLRTILIVVTALWAAWGIFRLEARLSDWDSPAQLYRSSLTATPNSPTLWFNLGFTLRESGDLAGAIDAYSNSIRFSPNYERAYSSLGETYARMNRFDDARAAYQQALALQPKDVGTALNLAVVLHQAGHSEEAEREFRRIIELAPNNSAAYTDLGVLLFQQKKTEEAETMFLTAIDRNPSDPTPYSDLALLYQQSGHPGLALALYRKLLILRPNDPEAIANIHRLEVTH